MFLNSIMLVGLGAAVVPLVLHLLSRARYKDVEWGAMLFLSGSDLQRRQSARFTQMLLLVMRSLVIALLAVALARPIVRGKWAGQEAEGRVTAALLLDCSASMNFDENGRTRFQMAQAAARQIIRGLRPGDRVALILMGGPRGAGELEPTGDLRAVEAKIDEAKVGFGRASLADSLDVAADVLGRYEKSARDVYVVCDRQALSWQGIDSHFTSEWKTRMLGPGLSTRMFVLPVGSADADNLAIESIRLLNAPAIVGQTSDVEVVIHNYGPVQHAAIPVTIEGAGLTPAERAVSLGPGQSVPVIFNVPFLQTGSQILTAKIKSSGYGNDDQLDMAVNVIAPIRVLVISGDEHSGQGRSGSDFLKMALSPHRAAGVVGADPCSVTVVSPETEVNYNKYQVVVVANVERFTPQNAHKLEIYVYVGGRVLFAPGSLSRVDDYNAQFYRDGAGVLPAMLVAPTAADGSESTSILGVQADHPIFQFLRGREDIPTGTVVRYFRAVPRQVDFVVLARYLNGDPFLIEGKSENPIKSETGRVLLMTTPLDADWSTLPFSNFYLPFVQSTVRYLASEPASKFNLQPRDSILLKLDEGSVSRRVTVTRPDGRTQKLDVVTRPEKQPEARYSDTEQPGTYRVKVVEGGKTTQTMFVVVPPRDESDLTQLSEDRWRFLERELMFTRVDPTARPVLETLAANREGRELWGMTLAAVIILALLEMFVARIGSVQAVEPKTTETPMESHAEVESYV